MGVVGGGWEGGCGFSEVAWPPTACTLLSNLIFRPLRMPLSQGWEGQFVGN